MGGIRGGKTNGGAAPVADRPLALGGEPGGVVVLGGMGEGGWMGFVAGVAGFPAGAAGFVAGAAGMVAVAAGFGADAAGLVEAGLVAVSLFFL